MKLEDCASWHLHRGELYDTAKAQADVDLIVLDGPDPTPWLTKADGTRRCVLRYFNAGNVLPEDGWLTEGFDGVAVEIQQGNSFSTIWHLARKLNVPVMLITSDRTILKKIFMGWAYNMDIPIAVLGVVDVIYSDSTICERLKHVHVPVFQAEKAADRTEAQRVLGHNNTTGGWPLTVVIPGVTIIWYSKKKGTI